MHDLGTLGGHDSHAYALNDAGAVVGWAETVGASGEAAFLYQGGRMVDLNTLTPAQPDASLSVVLSSHLSVALAINDRGQIVALGGDYDNVTHVYLLTPTAQLK